MSFLIVAEKPSVAKTIASVVGANQNFDGYCEGNNYLVSWCYGHLIEEAQPEDYDPLYKNWKLETLPIAPTEWKTKPINSSVNQLNLLSKLMKKKDVEYIIEATDAGREGELIFRRVYEYSKTKKPFKRLWISSLESNAIKDGLNNLKDSNEFDNLYLAAESRSHADWLFGINGTRYYTLSGVLSDGTASVGRVQTPTLNMIKKRRDEINNFEVEKRFAVRADFGTWKAETGKTKDEKTAKKCVDETQGKPFVVTSIEKTNKFVKAPLLFSLTALQREMNRTQAFSAAKTLELIQTLYEKKILSYPRTDSEYITEDMKPTYKKIISLLKTKINPELSFNANLNRIADNSKVSDHYAIICTEYFASHWQTIELNDDEKKIVDTISIRMIEAVAPNYEYEETKAILNVDDYSFLARGNMPTVLGWKSVNKNPINTKEDGEEKEKIVNTFPLEFEVGKNYIPTSCTVINKDTKPPVLYTEATLLADMEKAGSKDINDEVERKGLGTSATRAEIIEKLLSRGYIERKKKALDITENGVTLINSVADGFKNINTTVQWENRLLEIEKGTSKESPLDFCNSIVHEIVSIIEREEKYNNNIITISPCPWCGGNMKVSRDKARCTSCNKAFYFQPLWMPKNHIFDKEEAEALLNGKSIDTVMVSKKGSVYNVSASIDNEKTKNSNYVEWSFDFL